MAVKVFTLFSHLKINDSSYSLQTIGKMKIIKEINGIIT